MLHDAYATKDIASIFGIAFQNVLARAKRESWLSQPRPGRGGGFLWLVESMPAETQNTLRAALATQQLRAAAKAGAARRHAEAAARQNGLKELMGLPKGARLRAEARAALVGQFEGFAALAPLKLCEARSAFCLAYKTGQVACEPWVKETVPAFCEKTLFFWQKALKEKGVAALAGTYGHRKGTGLLEKNEAMQEIIVGMVATMQEPTCEDIRNTLKLKFPGQELPSLRGVQRFVAKWTSENEADLLCYKNPDAYRSKHQMALGSASEGIERPNQRWELDSSPTDIMLADGKRYTLLACIDVATRRVIFHLSRTSCSEGVCALLRKALLWWGVPEEIKTDNGSDYKSTQVLTAVHALGIQQTLCTPFTPTEKPHVERIFRTFQHGIVKLCPAYLGYNVAKRTEIENHKSFAARLAKKKGEKDNIEVRYTVEEFQQFADDWAHAMYGERKHGSLGASPNVFAARLLAEYPVVTVADERALDVLLLPTGRNNGVCTVSKKGIRIDNGEFWAPILAGYIGEQVKTYYGDDAGHLVVFDLDSNFICTAVNAEREGISRRDLAIAAKAAERAVRARGQKAIRKAVRAINKDTLAAELMAQAVAEAAPVQAARQVPAPVNTYTTPALKEAAIAARANEMPAPRVFTPEEVQRVAELQQAQAAYAKEATVEPPASRYGKHLVIEERIAAGLPVAQALQDWNQIFKTSAECNVFVRMTRAARGATPPIVVPYIAIHRIDLGYAELGSQEVLNG